MKQLVTFSQPILFLQFLTRAYHFDGKGTVRTEIPPDGFFYTGRSKAIVNANTQIPLIGFDNGTPCLSENISDELFAKVFSPNSNIVFSVTDENVDSNNCWLMGANKLMSNKTKTHGNSGQLPYANFKGLAPYHFNIKDVDADGTITSDFPRTDLDLYIKQGQTLCFLCRREEYSAGEWYTPNLNLVLFVKNHGFHNGISFYNQKDIDHINDTNCLSNGNFDVRDFRKSKFRFDLG